MRQIIVDLKEKHGCSPSVPTMRAPAKRKYEDWDVVSLESSEFDDSSSKASSSVFQMLGSAPVALTSGVPSPAEAIPVRPQMNTAAPDGPSAGGATRLLMSISPAEDKVAAASASSKLGTDKPASDQAQAPLSAPTRAPGILMGRREPPRPGSVESPVVPALLAAPATIDSADSVTSAGRRPPAGSSSVLYRTPSPRSCGRLAETLLNTGYSDVPRLDELNEPTLERSGISSCKSCDASSPSVSVAGDEASPRSTVSHVALAMAGDYASSQDSGDETDTTADASEIGMGSQVCIDREIDMKNNDRTIEDEELACVSEKQAAVAPMDQQSEKSPVDDAPNAVGEPAPTSTSSSSARHEDSSAGANAATTATGRPPKPTRSVATRGRTRRSARSSAVAEDPAPILPRRRAAAQGGDYAKRNSFLGSWPSRKQSAAAGTWDL